MSFLIRPLLLSDQGLRWMTSFNLNSQKSLSAIIVPLGARASTNELAGGGGGDPQLSPEHHRHSLLP